MIIRFLRAGIYTTIQDNGRMGLQHLGIPIGGSLDYEAAHAANQLCGNPISHPVLECTYSGPEILFDDDCVIAISGADMKASIDRKLVPLNQTLHIKKGNVLSLKSCETLCRSYIAIGGEWLLPKWMNSVSFIPYHSHLDHSIVKKYAEIEIKPNQFNTFISLKRKQYSTDFLYSKGPELNDRLFSLVHDFFQNGLTISADSNRMALRFKENLTIKEPLSHMVSSGVKPGTIQLTPSGEIIILLADAQSTGGYYRIGQIDEEQLCNLAQLRVNQKIYLSPIYTFE